MKFFIKIIITIFAAVCLTSCGSSDTFRVNGEVEGLGTRNLRFYYFDGKALQVGLSSAIDGKFYFEGRSNEPTLITITINQAGVIGHFIAENGDDISCTLSVNDPAKFNIDGNKDGVKLAKFISTNAETLKSKDYATINSLIEKNIAENPGSRAALAAFLIYYDTRRSPVTADSLLNLFDADVRTPQFIAGYQSMLSRFEQEAMSEPITPLTMFCDHDSLSTFNPAKFSRSLLTFLEGTDVRRDSVKAVIDSISKKYGENRLAIVNIGLEQDTLMWKKTLTEQPMAGENLWMPGAVANSQIRRLNISRTPLFIVCDSLGTQIYRGESITAACDSLKSLGK